MSIETYHRKSDLDIKCEITYFHFCFRMLEESKNSCFMGYFLLLVIVLSYVATIPINNKSIQLCS